MTERWLVTGGTGQVGTALRRDPPPGVEIFAPGRDVLDLANLPNDLSPFLEGVTTIINCAAYTAVDKAESEPTLAEAINAIAPRKLAKAAADAGILIIHISTDYVFPFNGSGPWQEDSPLAPSNVYGRTKLGGEVGIRTSGARHAIIRTAWVISAYGANFVKTMLRLGAENEIINVVSDQLGTPTHAGDLAKTIATIAQRFKLDPNQNSGTWHYANTGETTWHGLATETFEVAARHGFKTPQVVKAITTAAYQTAAKRPADSRLNTQQIFTDFRISSRPWNDALIEIIKDLAQEHSAQ